MKDHKKAVGKLCVNPKLPFDLCNIPHGTRLRFKGTSPDGCLIFEYEMPEVDDEKMVDAIRMSLMITMSDGALYSGCDITIEQAFAWLDEKKAGTTVLPELRESEDEEIYREIYSIVHNYYERKADLFASPRRKKETLEKWEKAKAYLEKQKDNKLAPRVLPCSAAWFEDGEEKQKEQKPAEWSEEDEKKLEDLTSLLAILEGCSTVNLGTSAKYCFWLNSIRSRLKSSGNWKPSKEQMDSLRDTIVQTKGFSYSIFLPELYEDLKKL